MDDPRAGDCESEGVEDSMKTYEYGDYCPYEGANRSWAFTHPTSDLTHDEFAEAVKRCYIRAEQEHRAERIADAAQDSEFLEIYGGGVFLSEYTDRVAKLLVEREGFVPHEPCATFFVRDIAVAFVDEPFESDGTPTQEIIKVLEDHFGKSPFDDKNTEPTEGV